MIGSEKFWSCVDQKKDGCWEWGLSLCGKGYGQAWYSDSAGTATKKDMAHRIAWRLSNGPIPAWLHVLHRCDNRKCCRPDHLFLGTNYDNVQDMIAKGRRRTNPPRGERAGMAKLTEKQVLKIAADTRSQRVIANEHGVCQQLISRIRHRQIWRHLFAN